MITIDGSQGEGGGQILRTALALSLHTGTAFRITKIRAGRARPGLMRQHLACVRAAEQIGGATVTGAELGSIELAFQPGAVRAGSYSFSTGGAGSTTLVWQTVLWPLLFAAEPSTLHFEGGTHNPMAPPFDFVRDTLMPQLTRLGITLELELTRHGFYPAGGGGFRCKVYPASTWSRLELLERGAVIEQRATALVAQIPPTVALRELDVLSSQLGWAAKHCKPLMVQDSRGPGNVLVARVTGEHVTESFAGFGERGVRAEQVAMQVAAEVARYLRAGVPVFEHLADQLLLPMALGKGGAFRTVKPTAHCLTQIQMLRAFLGVEVEVEQEGADVWRISI